MFGTLRLVLAAIVAFTHTVPCPPEFEFGVFAVVVFFLLSGYAMTGLVHTRFGGRGSAPAFYLERLLRIAPQCYFWLAVSCYLSFRLLWAPVKSEGFLPYGLFAYLTLLPLGLQGYIEPIRTLVLAQASSLGVEICFYIVTPWLVKSRSWSWIGAILCLGVFVRTVDGALPAALYTYYTVPWPLVLFILGSMAYRKQWKLTATLGTVLLIVLTRGVSQPYNLETAVGLVVGLIAIGTLSRRWDTALGNASYGAFRRIAASTRSISTMSASISTRRNCTSRFGLSRSPAWSITSPTSPSSDQPYGCGSRWAALEPGACVRRSLRHG